MVEDEVLDLEVDVDCGSVRKTSFCGHGRNDKYLNLTAVNQSDIVKMMTSGTDM
jgi:hypothetical protein